MKTIRIACDTKDKIPLETLTPLQGKLKNLSKANYTKLKNEILTTGFAFPFYVWKGPKGIKYIIGGHQRLTCLQSLKTEGYTIPEVPVVFVEAESINEAKRRVLQDVSQYGDVDKKGLFEFMFDAEITMDIMAASFQIPDGELNLKSFRNEFFSDETAESAKKDDEVPSVKKTSKTKIGYVYKLGNHRLICGDSTNKEHLKKLMGNVKADITFCSPPYNVGKTPNGNDKKYLNDSDDKTQESFAEFLVEVTKNALDFSKFAFINIQSLSGNKVALIEYLYSMKSFFADTIIWDKLTAEPAMAKNVLNSRFEYIHVFSDRATRVIGTNPFRGTLENIFQFNSRKDKEFAEIHKATYPVAFAEHFVLNFSSEYVLDLFGGTGTTMIACEKADRKCFMVELDPHYCDVIVNRWEKFTGKKSELISPEIRKRLKP